MLAQLVALVLVPTQLLALVLVLAQQFAPCSDVCHVGLLHPQMGSEQTASSCMEPTPHRVLVLGKCGSGGVHNGGQGGMQRAARGSAPP